MSRAKSESFDNIFQTRTPDRKAQQHKCTQQQHNKLCSPLPQKDGINPQNYLILTPNRDTLKLNKENCLFYTPQRIASNAYSSSSFYGSAVMQSQPSQKTRLSLDANDTSDFYQFGTIEPFNYGISSSPRPPRLESEKEDINRLRKDSMNPHGKDLEMLEGLIQQQPQLRIYQSFGADNTYSTDLDPLLVMQEIETAWLSLESSSSSLINSVHS